TAAIVASAEKPGTAEIVPFAIIPIARRVVRRAAGRSRHTIDRNVVVRRLMIARQEAVAMPMRDVSLVSRRGESKRRQQRQQNGNRYGYQAGHADQLGSRCTSLATTCGGAATPGRLTGVTPGRLTGRSPISSAVRTALLRQNANELMRELSRMAIA